MKIGGLVDEWRQAWKWFSVQLGILAAGAMEAYELFLPARQFIEDTIGKDRFHHLMAGLVFLAVMGRLIKQEKTSE